MLRTYYNEETKLWSGVDIPSVFNPKISLGHVILWTLQNIHRKLKKINDETNIQLTNECLRLKTIRAAQNLQKFGCTQNDSFAIVARNSQYVAPIVFASLCLGCPLNTLDTSFGESELLHTLSITQPKMVFCDADVYESVQSCLDKLENSAKIFTFCGQTGNSIEIEQLFIETSDEDNFSIAEVDGENDIAFVVCTSGTTGLPKGVSLSHAIVLNQASQFNADREDIVMCFSSLYWISGILVLTASTIAGSCRLITTERFSTDLMLNMIEKYQVTFFVSASHYLVLALRCDQFFKTDLSSIRKIYCGGTKLSTAIASNVLKYLENGEIFTCYGMSEMAGLISIGGVTSVDDESLGKLTPGLKVKIIDDRGHRLAVGEMGEICIKNKYRFMGYYQNSEATQNSIDNEGFLLTGDVGYFDGNGNLYLIDRKKELLKYCSSQISPTEIEQFLIQIESIKTVCVVGIPDPVVGDLPAAVIVLNGELSISADEIDEMVSSHFTDYKRLRGGIYFVDSLPITPSGKLLRRAVKDIAIDLYNERNVDN